MSATDPAADFHFEKFCPGMPNKSFLAAGAVPFGRGGRAEKRRSIVINFSYLGALKKEKNRILLFSGVCASFGFVPNAFMAPKTARNLSIRRHRPFSDRTKSETQKQIF